MILNRMDYHTLIKTKFINPKINVIISKYIEHLVFRIKKIFKVESIKNLTNDEIVERIYYLNQYRHNSLSNIYFYNRSMGKLNNNGKWNCILINGLQGPWYNKIQTDIEDKFMPFGYKEYWYSNGVHHRKYFPAFIINIEKSYMKIWYNNGKIVKKS
uniref:Uncharacterized protein n=1 Tax=viral metagenome TaxID=1070528 RepID=A0A6C0J5T8_9ZZZZ